MLVRSPLSNILTSTELPKLIYISGRKPLCQSVPETFKLDPLRRASKGGSHGRCVTDGGKPTNSEVAVLAPFTRSKGAVVTATIRGRDVEKTTFDRYSNNIVPSISKHLEDQDATHESWSRTSRKKMSSRTLPFQTAGHTFQSAPRKSILKQSCRAAPHWFSDVPRIGESGEARTLKLASQLFDIHEAVEARRARQKHTQNEPDGTLPGFPRGCSADCLSPLATTTSARNSVESADNAEEVIATPLERRILIWSAPCFEEATSRQIRGRDEAQHGGLEVVIRTIVGYEAD